MEVDKTTWSLALKKDRRVTGLGFQNSFRQDNNFGIIDDVSPERLGQRQAIQMVCGIRGVKNWKYPNVKYFDPSPGYAA